MIHNWFWEKNYLLYSGLTLKCVTNGDIPEKDVLPKRFEEKNVDCTSKFCASVTPLWPGSESLLICGPNEEDQDPDGGKEEQSGGTEIYPDFILIYDTSKERSDTQLFGAGKSEGVALARGLHAAYLPQKDIDQKVNLT